VLYEPHCPTWRININKVLKVSKVSKVSRVSKVVKPNRPKKRAKVLQKMHMCKFF
jgi:hypothetical protein